MGEPRLGGLPLLLEDAFLGCVQGALRIKKYTQKYSVSIPLGRAGEPGTSTLSQKAERTEQFLIFGPISLPYQRVVISPQS